MQNQGITFCSNCGGQNTLDNNFCLYCGNALSKPNQPNTTVSNQNGVVQQQPQQSQQKPERKLGFLGWFGIIMMGLGSVTNIFMLTTAVVLGIIYFTIPSSKNIVIIIIRVIGAINITFLTLALILFGACFGIIGAGA